MERLTLRELLEAMNGRLIGDFDDLDATVDTIEKDSRTITPGAL